MYKQEAIRDPVHKWIKFSTEEKAIIDSPFFQRLRWISQLTSADHVFPGGTHNRFIHSLGAMYLAGKYMKSLFKNTPLPENACDDLCAIWENKDKYIKIARIAALLHDIGHGPFSHAYDRTIYKKIYNIDDGGHDIHRFTIINDNNLKGLIEACGISIVDIEYAWHDPNTELTKNTIYQVIQAVVQGPLGADRMDFTLRDSYFTGTEHLGTISPQRIISNSRINIENPSNPNFTLNLAYHTKTLSDIIQALDGRFRMYDCVYLHKSVFASGVLVEKMMEEAHEHLKLVERTRDINEFLLINDNTIIGEIISSTSPELEVARNYCKRLLFRRLPKLCEEHYASEAVKFDTILCNFPEYNDTEKYSIVKTKNISGISTKLFDDCGILFTNGKVYISCQDALKKIEYTPSRKPFYYVRVYKF